MYTGHSFVTFVLAEAASKHCQPSQVASQPPEFWPVKEFPGSLNLAAVSQGLFEFAISSSAFVPETAYFRSIVSPPHSTPSLSPESGLVTEASSLTQSTALSTS